MYLIGHKWKRFKKNCKKRKLKLFPFLSKFSFSYQWSIFHLDNIIDFNMEEGGFIVIENKDGKLIAQHKFYYFSDFSSKILKRPNNP